MFRSKTRPSSPSLGCLAAFVGAALAPLASADVTADPFGSGEHEFTLEFVTISQDTNPPDGLGRVEYDYRMGVYQVTADQWQKAGMSGGDWSGNQPVGNINWFEAARFVNWLNTSTGHPPAYRFEGEDFELWDAEDAWPGTDGYRHKDAHYFLPSQDEWVKAGYWNSTTATLQTYATPGDTVPVENSDARFGQTWSCGPWEVGTGSEELNGTYDMMGNLWEWMERPYHNLAHVRLIRGGGYSGSAFQLRSSTANNRPSADARSRIYGFRVASAADAEPATIEVAIEIRPGGKPNPINLQARGVVPVAILSTDDFDALSVDEETVLFADPVRLDEELGLPVSPIRSAIEDVDGDGRDDLLLFFSIPELVEFGAFDEASVLGTLFGETFDAVPIEGFDSVRIVPPPARGAPARGAPARGRGR